MLETAVKSSNPDELKKIIKDQNLRILQLEELLRYFKGERFGSSSEKLSEDQLRLFNIKEDDVSPEEIEEEKIEGYTRKKCGRKKLSDKFEKIRVEHDLKPEEKQCPCGCGEMERIGEEISEQVEFIPSVIKVIENVRFKYACRKCHEGVFISSLPPQILPKSNATPGFLAHIAVSKFQDALPLYRQSLILKRSGLDISRTTLSNWMLKLGEKVQPLVNLILDHIIESSYIGMDETPVQVLNEENRKAQSQSYMWVARGGPPGQTATLFYYDPHKNRKVLKEIVEGFKGYFQCDGYKVYTGLDKSQDIRILGCFAHARRKFYTAIKAGKHKEGVAVTGLNFIRQLYRIEKEVKEKSAQERFDRRQKDSKSILDEMKIWLDNVIVKVLPKTETGKALHYLSNNWNYLIRYTEDGDLRIDNNLVENAIRPFVVGRKNWLFCDSPAGAQATANLYTLIETAKNNKWEPFEYLRAIFYFLPYCENLEQYEFLLPWNLPKQGEQCKKIPF